MPGTNNGIAVCHSGGTYHNVTSRFERPDLRLAYIGIHMDLCAQRGSLQARKCA
jgi:hypothetical protein